MKSFLNFLKRNKLYSAINILGLSLSLAFVLLLSVYTYRQLSIDSYQKNADRIYLISNEEYLEMAYYMSRYLKQEFPEIEASASYAAGEDELFQINGKSVSATVAFADSSFFDMFSFKILEGSMENWKASKDRAFVSRSFALANFEGDPTGKSMVYRGHELIIAGVIENIRNSVIMDKDIFIRGEYMGIINFANNEDMQNAGAAECFVMAYPQADLPSRKDDILSYFKKTYWPYQAPAEFWNKVRIIPLKELYFLKDGYEDEVHLNLGNRSIVNILLALCLILLIFAILNYVNMTTALMGFRSKEMALRRLNGASRGNIFLKAIAESTIICAISMILAIIIAEAIAPAASSLVNYDISLFGDILPITIGFGILLTLVTGFIAGMIPASLIQRVQPIEVVRGMLRVKTKTVYSKVIIIVQNTITATMLVVVFSMYLQVNSMISAPLGYETKDQLIVANKFGNVGILNPLIDRLKSESCVDEVGLGNGHPLRGTNNNTMRREDGKWVSFQQIYGDSAYFNILGIRKKTDNNSPFNWWLNEYAFKEIGIEESELQFIGGGSVYEIGGIYYDFKINGLLEPQSAAMMYQADRLQDSKYPWTLLIKTNGDHKAAYSTVHNIIEELFPEDIIEAEYVEDMIAHLFDKEKHMLKIMILFTIISMLISALGLIGMSSYYMQQQRRSISLKKVFGASLNGVLTEIILSFMKLTGIAFIVSVPVSWCIMHKYLESFSYRITLSWWIFAIAGLFIAVIAAISVLWQSLRAAHTEPSKELKKD